MWKRKDEILEPLDCIKDHINRELLFVCAFMHHDDGEVDVINRMLIGRFFATDTPVPDGYDHHDLSPQTVAYAVFESMTADVLWQRYEVTRDTILADGITIPYPVGYWHAEVYFDKTPMIKDNDPPFIVVYCLLLIKINNNTSAQYLSGKKIDTALFGI